MRSGNIGDRGRASAPEAAEHEALPLKPAELVHIGRFTITNSMLVTWFVAAGIIVFAQMAMRKVKSVPSGAQNFWEWLVESLYNFLEGHHWARAGAERRFGFSPRFSFSSCS